MNKHYHIGVLLLGIALIVVGVLIGLAANWGVRVALIAIAIFVLAYLWHKSSFVSGQVKRFFLAIRNRDFMIRFPRTADGEIEEMYSNMNDIMQLYSSSLMDIETKRLYYDRILRVMTHELRNSITPVISLVNDMLKRPEAYEEDNRTEGLTVISEQCTSIKSFLDSYYALTHLPKPNIKEIDIKTFFDKIRRLAGYHDSTQVEFFYTPGMTCKADPDLLIQVLTNLVKNAVEAASSVGEAHVVVRATSNSEYVMISVLDNGPGIPDDLRSQIFLPFYTTKDGGSGIGLCLSKQIAHLHKGELVCTSSELGGAEFTLRIPLLK